MSRSFIRILGFLGILLWCTSAAAQPTGDELQRYEDYLQRGSRAFEAQDYEAALLLFGKAQEIHDHPRLRFSMARIYEELEQCVAAKMMYVILMENESAPEELRKEAGLRLAAIEECGVEEETPAAETAPAEPVETPALPMEIDEPVRAAATSRALRNIGVWSIAGGAVLTAGGLLVATTVFVPADHRACFGIGVGADDQVAACERIAGSEEEMDFFAAHVKSRRVVQQHRVASTALIAAGLAGSGLGLTLLFVSRNRQTALLVGPADLRLVLLF